MSICFDLSRAWGGSVFGPFFGYSTLPRPAVVVTILHIYIYIFFFIDNDTQFLLVH